MTSAKSQLSGNNGLTMIGIYTDTNVLRYFGQAFSETSLAEDVQAQLLVAPLALMELLSQLGTGHAVEAFAAIQALPKIHNAKATGILPWSDDLFRASLFNLPMRADTMTTSLSTAVTNVLNANIVEDLGNSGVEFRAMLDAAKAEATENFANLRASWRTEGALPEEEHRVIFARAIARRAGADEEGVDVDLVVNRLQAQYTFEKTRIQVAARAKNYNIEKHANDIFDSELLIYLAEPTFHLLTSDSGFRRVSQSSQADRVHIIEPKRLLDASSATEVLREIIRTTSTS